MKKLFSYIITLCGFIILSCDDSDVAPEVNFIKARIDGVETIYTTVPETQDYYNYIKPGAISIRLNKSTTSTQYWAIDMYIDINTIQLPLIIKGPIEDFSGKTPELHTNIIDPDGAPYGKFIAGGSTFDNDMTFEITSVDNDIIKGTFKGNAFGTFENGEFSVKLPRKSW